MTRFLIAPFAAGLAAVMIAAPPPKGNAPQVTFIDLQPQANHKLTDRFGRIEGNNLASLRTGEQTCAEVKFNVAEGILLLDSPRLVEHKAARASYALSSPSLGNSRVRKASQCQPASVSVSRS